jgi:hypothetical protein
VYIYIYIYIYFHIGKDTKLTLAAFKAWSDIKEMIEDGVVTKQQLDEMVSEAANGKKNLDFEQFFSIVSQLDELAEGEDDEDFDDEEVLLMKLLISLHACSYSSPIPNSDPLLLPLYPIYLSTPYTTSGKDDEEVL